MTRCEKTGNRLIIFLTGGLLVAWFIHQNQDRKPRLPQLKKIQKGLTEKFGEVEAAFVVGELEKRYEALFSQRPRFREKRLQSHVDHLIIPVLALYQVLIEKFRDKELALDEVHDLMLQIVVGKSRLIISMLKKFPNPFYVFRHAVRLVNKIAFPAPGWKIEYLDDSQKRIAFNIHKCFYLNVLTTYESPELAKVFCRFDDDFAKLFNGNILWNRESTLARGAVMCDFCYENFDSKKYCMRSCECQEN